MKQIETTIHNAKTHLSKYLAMLERREIDRVVIGRRNEDKNWELTFRPLVKPQIKFGALKDLHFDKEGADQDMKEIWDEYHANLEKPFPEKTE
jgi:hypothetical protein